MGVREVREGDLPEVVAMVYGLAEYERAPDDCKLTVEQLRGALFGPHPALFGHVAEVPETGELAGMALWFLNFSTWEGEHGIYLEDLFVRPEHRGGGYGKALMVELARVCERNGYRRLQWAVLDWNQPSIDFYRSLGAVPEDEWVGYRLTDDALTELASG
ncbi:GNAT family N-acetyltransferase [Pseudonocardia eucalypti]|uniref:GNAT family N-acetyltransferase n=1 Tax=Pseudonocardia eucalypti TaxID=648755 RepID=A0ABP9PG54_9PSEU|nr:GNAT superfamily N-acetyltransferase [Pseudonocardia eucalypti]